MNRLNSIRHSLDDFYDDDGFGGGVIIPTKYEKSLRAYLFSFVVPARSAEHFFKCTQCSPKGCRDAMGARWNTFGLNMCVYL